ncbi:MAG: prephenate dehydratase domain-containing protein [Pseudomonadota bacterium]
MELILVNLIDGLVQETLDRLLACGAVIYAATQRPIRISAGAAGNAAPDAPVYSHPKALAQCSEWLDRHEPGRERIAVASTAHGAEQARAEGALAVASESTLEEHGLTVLERDATNRYFGRVNYTEFLLVGPPGLTPPAGEVNRCVLACAPQTDRPGLLADILGLLSMFRFNLARLHSRPAIESAPTQLDPQVFYLEIAGAPSDEELRVCADALAITLGGGEDQQVLFRLGRYPLKPL